MQIAADQTNRIRYAFRVLVRQPALYVVATAILAVGIGTSVAIFSLVEAVLLHPLPFPAQDSLEVIWKADPLAGTQVEELAYPELQDLQQAIPDFESVALMPTTLYGYGRVLQRTASDPVEIESAPVSHDFFHVLGVVPVLGRDFSDSDERVGAAPVVILSDRIWREEFGTDRNIVGQMIRLNNQGCTVIGVLGAGVEFPRGAGLWIPLGVDPRVVERRGNTFLQAIARRKPGRTHAKVLREVNALFKTLAREYPQFYSPSQEAVVKPLVEYWTGSARHHLWIMFSAALVLLITSTISAGNLLLPRTMMRRPEFATRLALGAGHRQIFLQIAAEGSLVVVAAIVAGLWIAYAAIRLLISLAPAEIPRLSEARLDLAGFVVAAGAGVSRSSSVLFFPVGQQLVWI